MKKIITLGTIFILALLIGSCKKGEDDPFFSLHTRKARLAGDWKMTEGKITIGIKDSTGAYASQIYELTEDGYKYSVTGTGANFQRKASLNLSITKKGVITINQVMDSVSIESSGTWDFLGKVGENKNKETISIRLSDFNNQSDLFRTFNKGTTNFMYHIKELRNKRMVLENKEEMILLKNGIGVYITSQYTFVQ